MQKTSVFTTCTPLPAGITRQAVLETYHNHVEMIELNPLVVEKFQCKAPSHAPAEEFYATWYTIKGSVSYHACFHDLPDGLQTHVYAPLGLDIRAKWSVGGSLPGEPKAPVELGLGAPRDGLYIREDVKMKCNIMMLSFVKKTFKESHGKLVDRLVEKAHQIEAKAANERLNQLKTLDPRDRSSHGDINIAPPPGYAPSPSQHPAHLSMYGVPSPLSSPGFTSVDPHASYNGPGTPPYHLQQQQRPDESRVSYHPDARNSTIPEHLNDKRYEPSLPSTPGTVASQPSSHHDPRASTYHAYQPQHPPAQLSAPGQGHNQSSHHQQNFAAELPAEAPSKNQQSFTAELPA